MLFRSRYNLRRNSLSPGDISQQQSTVSPTRDQGVLLEAETEGWKMKLSHFPFLLLEINVFINRFCNTDQSRRVSNLGAVSR